MATHRIEVARHFRSAMAPLRETLLPTVSPAGPLHHLAQCTGGVLDFAIDPAGAGPEGDEARARDELLRGVDYRLSLKAEELDRRLEPARSGALIRLVTQSERGVVCCDRLVPGTYLIGAYDQDLSPRAGGAREGFDRADEALALLSTSVRRRFRLGSVNPGAFERDRSAAGTRRPATSHHAFGPGDESLIAALVAALSPDDAHYLAYYRSGEQLAAVDVLEHEDLAVFSAFIDAADRRHQYDAIGREFDSLIGELGRIVCPLIGSPLTRVVLDVEQGALYYFRIHRGEYIFGATLDQQQVLQTDLEIERVATARRDRPSPSVSMSDI